VATADVAAKADSSQPTCGPEVGAFYRDVHRDHGVELALGEGVEAFESDGAVARVRTAAGRVIECDFVVVGIGVSPRIELAGHAGLELQPRTAAADALTRIVEAASGAVAISLKQDQSAGLCY